MSGNPTKFLSCLAASLVLAVLAATPVRAQDNATSEFGGWEFQISPYAWFVSLDGKAATIRGLPSVDVDANFSDVWDNKNFGALTVLEARRDRFGLKADLIYLDLEASKGTPGPLFSGTDAEFKTFVSTVSGTYRPFVEGRTWLDVLAGARIWVTDTEITLNSNVLPNLSADEKETWVDPIVGTRGTYDLGSGFSLSGYGDIGGFGVSSDLTYQIYGGVGYRFKEWFSAELGYRVLDVDYEDDGFVYDLTMYGPTAGFRFWF